MENPENLPIVNHRDENKLNNCVDNLEWCTFSYNNTYGVQAEARKARVAKVSLPCWIGHIETKVVKWFPSIRAASRYIGDKGNNLNRCLQGQALQCLGWIASFCEITEEDFSQYLRKSAA